MTAADPHWPAADGCRIALVRPAPDIETPSARREFEQLSGDLGIPLIEAGVAPQRDTRCDVYLSLDETGPYLQLTGSRAPGPVRCGFYDPAMAYRRRGGQNELLGRAVGVNRRPDCRVIDATAGFAVDGFVLADLGARVVLCERHPLLAALIGMSVRRLRDAESDWRQAVVSRLSVRAGDARSLPATELCSDDVLYLDPMFPGGRRAAAGKGMTLLQRLLSGGPEDAAESLMRWALGQRVWRVVVKRPVKAPALAGARPSHTLAGRSVRFDVYQLDGGSDNGS